MNNVCIFLDEIVRRVTLRVGFMNRGQILDRTAMTMKLFLALIWVWETISSVRKKDNNSAVDRYRAQVTQLRTIHT